MNLADCSAIIRQRPSLGLRGSSGAGSTGGRSRRGSKRATNRAEGIRLALKGGATRRQAEAAVRGAKFNREQFRQSNGRLSSRGSRGGILTRASALTPRRRAGSRRATRR